MRNNWHQDSASLPGTDPFFKTCFKVVKISLFIFVLPKKRGRKCVWLHVCVCFVCFIVMSRTSSIVPCQVVPSQLAVANAFVLCCAVYSPYDIVVKSLLICSAFLIHFVCVCVYGSHPSMGQKPKQLYTECSEVREEWSCWRCSSLVATSSLVDLWC